MVQVNPSSVEAIFLSQAFGFFPAMASIDSVVQPELEISEHSEQFTYSDALLQPDEVRVLSLSPTSNGADGSDIHCQLFRLDLRETKRLETGKHPFVALSYLWGSTESLKTIVINGKRKSVTTNLYEALRKIRDQMSPIPLWVDAVCINQDSMEERSREVRKMNRIYAECWAVLFWLGPIGDPSLSEEEQDHAEFGANIIGHVSESWRMLKFSVPGKFLRSRGKHTEESNPWMQWKFRQRVAKQEKGVTDMRMNVAVFDLISLDFWKRVWITQEVILAEKGYFLWGGHTFELELLETLANVRDEFMPMAYPYFNLNEGAVDFALVLKTLDMRSRPIGLLEALLNVRHRKAAEKHDYLYGLNSIARLQEYGVEIDYSQPLRSVYSEAVAVILKQERTLDFLSACERGWDSCRHSEGDNWPTWLPDWSYDSIKTVDRREHFLALRSLLLDCVPYGDPDFRACGDTQHEASISPDGKRLTCQGRKFDSITFIIGTQDEPWEAAVRKLWDERQLSHVYASLKTLKEVCVSMAAYGRSHAWHLRSPNEEIEKAFQEDEDGTVVLPGPVSEPFYHEVMVPPKDSESTHLVKFFQIDQCESWYFCTERGYIGRSSVRPEKGDLVVILCGGKVPLLLRRSTKGTLDFQLAGEACMCHSHLVFFIPLTMISCRYSWNHEGCSHGRF